MPGRTAEGGAQTRERVLEAAIGLFSRRGFAETSVRDIAAAVKIRPSSLYNHFPSKEAILEAILGRYRELVNRVRIPDEKLEQVVGALGPDEILRRGRQRIRETVLTPSTSRIVRILMMEMYRNPKVRRFFLRWYFDENRRAATKLFKAMQDRGWIRSGDPEAMASIHSAFVNAWYQEYFLCQAQGRDATDLERRLEAETDLFLSMLKRQPGKEGRCSSR